jgi:hypothetical protein
MGRDGALLLPLRQSGYDAAAFVCRSRFWISIPPEVKVEESRVTIDGQNVINLSNIPFINNK